MELAEPIERINSWLVDQYGIDTVTGLPIWRVVWSNDQYEKRKMSVTDEGIHLLTPIMREVPKYQHIQERYVLERLTVTVDNEEISGNLSYEPMWTFEDKHRNYLPPKIDACKIIVDTVYAATRRGGAGDTEVRQGSMRKYVDELANLSPEAKAARIDGIVQDLFGNETETTDALSYKEGVVVPRKQFGE